MTQQRHALTDAQWQRMVVHLPPVLGRPGRDDRLFIDAVLWIAKTGSPWRDLPAHLGAWAQVYQRFARWSERGHFSALFLALQEPDHEQLMVFGTNHPIDPVPAAPLCKREIAALSGSAGLK